MSSTIAYGRGLLTKTYNSFKIYPSGKNFDVLFVNVSNLYYLIPRHLIFYWKEEKVVIC